MQVDRCLGRHWWSPGQLPFGPRDSVLWLEPFHLGARLLRLAHRTHRDTHVERLPSQSQNALTLASFCDKKNIFPLLPMSLDLVTFFADSA